MVVIRVMVQVRVCLIRVVLPGKMFVKGRMRRNCGAEDAFPDKRNDRVADRGDADGTDIADDENQQKIAGFSVELKKSGSDHCAEDNVERMEDGEKNVAASNSKTSKKKHKNNACNGPEDGERRMLFELPANQSEFFECHKNFLLNMLC